MSFGGSERLYLSLEKDVEAGDGRQCQDEREWSGKGASE